MKMGPLDADARSFRRPGGMICGFKHIFAAVKQERCRKCEFGAKSRRERTGSTDDTPASLSIDFPACRRRGRMECQKRSQARLVSTSRSRPTRFRVSL